MLVSPGDGLFAVAILSGTVLCWLGIYSYRRWDQPGIIYFGTAAVFIGLGGIVGAVVAIGQNDAIPEESVPVWANIALLGWVLAMVPWLLFSLQYTGRYTQLRRRTIAVMSLPIVGLVGLIIVQIFGTISRVLVSMLATFAFLYIFSLSIVGCYLIIRTTYEYAHLSLTQGLCLATAGIGPLVVVNSIGILIEEASDIVVFSVYALAFVIPAAALALAIFRYDVFESTPAVGALGERAIPRETDDLVFVVDLDERVITINETATERLDVSPSGPLGESLSSVLGVTVEQLQGTETVELATAVGKRKFDPQVTAFTDQHDRRLGHLLSLRDVTDRELRKQRLEVLNRVLRHNLRNRVDVIKSNAEAVAADADSEHADAIHDSADELANLSSKARTTDQLVSRPARHSQADLVAVLQELVDTDIVTLDVPDAAPLVTDWDAMRGALDSAIENAVEHADESVSVTVEPLDDGYEIVVADDGPGIPASELASLDAETETPLQHGTGLGLWQLKWSVTKLNGDLSFETADGTTVRMSVPDQSA